MPWAALSERLDNIMNIETSNREDLLCLEAGPVPAPSGQQATRAAFVMSRSEGGSVLVDSADRHWFELHGLEAATPFALDRLLERIDAPHDEAYLRSLVAAMDARLPWQHEYPVRRPGAVRWLRASVMPREDTKPAWFGFVVDITREKLAALAMESSSIRNRLLMRTTSDGLHILDHENILLDASDAFCRMLGYTRAEMLGMHVSSWDPNWSVDRRWERLAATDGSPVVFESVHLRRDGRPVPVEVLAASSRHEGSVYVCASSRDISHRKRIEDELRVTATAFSSKESMFIMDPVRRVVKVNLAYTQNTGYAAEEIIGRLPPVLRPGLHDASWLSQMWRSLRQDGHWTGEIYAKRKNGEIYLARVMLTAVTRPDGHVASYVGIETDITLQKQAEEEAVRLAYYDALTGLPNRRLLAERVQHALRRAERSGRHNALLFLDLDNFKSLNDSLGHEAGDLLLQGVGERLLACMRASDTVARLAGDEFVIVLEDLDPDVELAQEQARSAAAKAQSSLNVPFSIQGWEHSCTPSIGLVVFGAGLIGFEDLLKHADVAMYHAKADGRNMVRAYVPGMQHPVRSRRALSQSMREGMRAGAFFLEYQPQISSSGRICAGEALLRWRHPARGLVPPTEFIPLAERNGLIVELGAMVIEQACRQLIEWDRRGLVLESLGVNVSAIQVRDRAFVPRTLGLLDQYGIDPRRLTLEITETAGLGDLRDAFDKLHQLKNAGISLALDDFGVGHASLEYLHRLPFDQIKIDKAFVAGLPGDPRDRLIAGAILALGARLEIEVVAEGVETEEQHAWLRDAGCKVFQGYLFSAPLGPDVFLGLALGSSERS
jgi:diguanylate cyclase (GGDEF)-like protein/PAS domain S-box-containing protein